MKAWTHNRFQGFYPVGTAAVVIAETPEQAKKLLDERLLNMALPSCDVEDFQELDTTNEHAIILCDGEY